MIEILEKVRPFGYTPLISNLRNEVLKYNFRGISRLVVDKSGHGNNGKLKPRENPPKRKVISWFPLKCVIDFTEEKGYVETFETLKEMITDEFTIQVIFKLDDLALPHPQTLVHIGGYRIDMHARYPSIEFIARGERFAIESLPEPKEETHTATLSAKSGEGAWAWVDDNLFGKTTFIGGLGEINSKIYLGRLVPKDRWQYTGKIEKFVVRNKARIP